MNVFVWHVHGTYTTALVQGRHRYLIPVLPDRGPYGRGRARTWDWPESAVEVTPAEAAQAEVDLVILQRPGELAHVASAWLGGRVPGVDVPAVYLEHNAPQGRVNDLRHPAADAPGVTVVHVTKFNALFWDTGNSPVSVIEHGVVDPGHRWTGELPQAVAVVNEPVRRARVTGTDLLGPLAIRSGVPVDLFGMASEPLGGVHLGQAELHAEMPRRRVYLHPFRWTSLGLTLLEAMHLGMPVVALATTEVPAAVPAEAGIVSNDGEVLAAGLRRLAADPEEAELMGKAAREVALERYGLGRFLDDWDRVFEEVAA
ncbi:MAG TPA: glycosyltransferase [Acidimicrobiales bacterium]|nr:glycosyltransferase [Acidimicrobiales bacterium]